MIFEDLREMAFPEEAHKVSRCPHTGARSLLGKMSDYQRDRGEFDTRRRSNEYRDKLLGRAAARREGQ